jgi:hypothetical protein
VSPGFNPKAPPRKTEAFWAIVNAGRSPEDAEMADCLECLQNPPAITLAKILGVAEKLFPQARNQYGETLTKSDSFTDWLKDRKNRRIIPHRLEACGYVPVRNPNAGDGLWKAGGKRQVIYAQQILNLRDQIDEAGKIVAGQ